MAAESAKTKIIAPKLGYIKSATGKEIKVDQSFLTAASVLFDAVYVPGGAKSSASLKENAQALQFVYEAYKHGKAIAMDDESRKGNNREQKYKRSIIKGLYQGYSSGILFILN